MEVVLLVVAGKSQDKKLLFYYPGQSQRKEQIIMRPGVKEDQPLLLKKTEDENSNAKNHAHSS